MTNEQQDTIDDFRAGVLEDQQFIDMITAAAVQAEREACRKSAVSAIMKIKTGTQEARDWTMADLRGMCADTAAAAIRARNGAGK